MSTIRSQAFTTQPFTTRTKSPPLPPTPAQPGKQKPAIPVVAHPHVPENPTSSASDALSTVPSGPFPLPDLRADATPHRASQNQSNVQTGSSWTASLARGILPALPLHWLAEATRAAAQYTAQAPSTSSIFRGARRSAEWLGCKRPHHLVCKGVYRAIKATNTLSLLDYDCAANVDWLPFILRKLQRELRPVRLFCAAAPAALTELRARRAQLAPHYADVGLEDVVAVDVSRARVPDGIDMFVAYRAVQRGTLIDAMRFFKNIKASRAVTFLVVETFPDVDNAAAVSPAGRLRINAGAAPFWFPAPVFEYANDDENSEDIDMEIIAVRTDEMFEERATPEMKDLVDPRKRVVQE